VSPERADRVGPIEVGEHQDVEQLGALSRAERVQALSESALKFVGSHQPSAFPGMIGDGVDGSLEDLGARLPDAKRRLSID
jgi:hypothetical protein